MLKETRNPLLKSEQTADIGTELEPLALLVAGGSTVRAAAEKIGISERSAYRTSGTNEFKRRVAEIRTEVASSAVGRLTEAASQAADTLIQLLAAENDPKDRLAAAKLILTSIGPISEHAEFRHRVDKLEQRR